MFNEKREFTRKKFVRKDIKKKKEVIESIDQLQCLLTTTNLLMEQNTKLSFLTLFSIKDKQTNKQTNKQKASATTISSNRQI